jgi:hypothetical protein
VSVIAEDLDSQLPTLCHGIFVVVADPCLHVRFVVRPPAEWGGVKVVVAADEQVEATLVGRVGVEDAVGSIKEDAQTRQLAFRERDLTSFQSVPASS